MGRTSLERRKAESFRESYLSSAGVVSVDLSVIGMCCCTAGRRGGKPGARVATWSLCCANSCCGRVDTLVGPHYLLLSRTNVLVDLLRNNVVSKLLPIRSLAESIR